MIKSYKRLEAITNKLRKLQVEWWSIRKSLIGHCEHPNPIDYEWSHDNGYGKQSTIKGKECIYCGAKDRWNRGVFSIEDYT